MFTCAKAKGRKKAFTAMALVLSLLGSSVTMAAPANELLTSNGSGMVVSSQPLADKIGQDVLNKGGNAIDAAVAVGYALAVCHPNAGNIGGGGFAVIHLKDGEDLALDFREVAPGKATRDMYLDDEGNVDSSKSRVGYLSVGVPGTVAGMSEMLNKYGTKSLKELIAPSIEMAEKGFTVSRNMAGTLQDVGTERFTPYKASRKYFLHKDGSLYKEGELFVQKDLAKVLRRIADDPRDFYTGKTAKLIVKDMEENGGLITADDLAKYKPVWRKPSETTYRGYKIISMAPPSSGGPIIAEILNIMENADIQKSGFGTPQTIHIMAEAMRRAYADRSEYFGDPDFVDVPVKELTDKAYAKKLYETIDATKATPSSLVKPGLGPIKEGTQTTHYSVVDRLGNAVSVTYTINDWYGSGVAVEGAGFLLNDEMDDFSAKPGVPNMYGVIGGDANSIAPYKRPLSSMSPSIISKDGKIFMVVGSPGGSRIITTVLQVISNVIDHKMPVNEAVSAPRFHMQWLPDEIRLEPDNGLSDKDKADLEARGYHLTVKPYMGDVNAIIIDPETGKMTGSHDSRTDLSFIEVTTTKK
ncbi:MAG: gamma-glutamyltransferase [Acidaminococcus sp.]|jgi:gamma-glutamyltranspeptidase/glutathione hydrolase|nr:gamma-glutamyltransferase [Acidaminococcus sp.]MCI2100498.1 gamma-glutamyltransferase [Acidaminococcus sp.]MCI2114841.1 gamma-glutamyltransferase [Acidaminococcus sp.]MCI2116872.1 gamma-glutamyltransferase [Acidaminococcus sp.]